MGRQARLAAECRSLRHLAARAALLRTVLCSVRRRLYLAGPDVFLPDAATIGARKRALCRDYGFDGLYPLDNAIEEVGPEAGAAIYAGNVAMMRGADAVVANLTPFRGPSADVGTAFELGFMAGLRKPCFAYSNDARPFLERVGEAVVLTRHPDGRWLDAHGISAEDFGLADNLMLDCAVTEAGSRIVLGHCAPERRFTDLSAFEACLQLAQDAFMRC